MVIDGIVDAGIARANIIERMHNNLRSVYFLKYVIHNRKVVGNAACQHKQVPYTMKVEFFNIQNVKDYTNAIEHPTSQ